MNGTATDRASLPLVFSEFANVSRGLDAASESFEHRISALTAQLAKTDRERKTDLLEKQRIAQRYGNLLSALPGGVIVLDGSGVVQECNPAAERLIGCALSGRSWRDVAAVAFTPAPDDGHDITLATGYRVNLSTCSLDGEPGQILMLADVTETRRLQDQAARLERLTSVGRTVAALAHQVRTPLSAAVLYASGLAAGAHREKILARLSDLERLVDDMLSYAKRGEFTLEPVDVAALLRALEVRQAPAQRAHLRVIAPDASLPVWVRANRDALISVLQNLLDNAWQADPEASVVLSVRPQVDGTVGIVCRDSGPGIPERMRERIFDPFFTTRAAGTGLGLAIVRAVVEAHDGEVVIGPGGAGATFLVRLPAMTHCQAAGEGNR